jgi:hypothetical protein
MLDEKPHKRYRIVTIIGSTRFDKEIREWAWEHTKKGYLILFAPFAKEAHERNEFGKDNEHFEQYRFLLEEQHFQKMEMSDIIFVFNKGDYVGDSTYNELKYTEDTLHKTIRYLEPSASYCKHEKAWKDIKNKYTCHCKKCGKILVSE